MARHLFGSFGKIIVWLFIIGFVIAGFYMPGWFAFAGISAIVGPSVAIPAILATRGKHLASTRKKRELMQEVKDCFSDRKLASNWVPAQGTGELNYTLQNTRSGAEPMISIEFDESNDGTIFVSIWMSAWSSGGLNGGRGTPFWTWGASRALRKVKETAARVESLGGALLPQSLKEGNHQKSEDTFRSVPDAVPPSTPVPALLSTEAPLASQTAVVKKTSPQPVQKMNVDAAKKSGAVSELGHMVIELSHILVCKHSDSKNVLDLAQARRKAVNEKSLYYDKNSARKGSEETDGFLASSVKRNLNDTCHNASIIRGMGILGALDKMDETAETHYLTAMSALAADSTLGGIRKAIDELSVASRLDHQNRAYPIIIEALQAEL
jgi:hypothetical protein